MMSSLLSVVRLNALKQEAIIQTLVVAILLAPLPLNLSADTKIGDPLPLPVSVLPTVPLATDPPIDPQAIALRLVIDLLEEAKDLPTALPLIDLPQEAIDPHTVLLVIDLLEEAIDLHTVLPEIDPLIDLLGTDLPIVPLVTDLLIDLQAIALLMNAVPIGLPTSRVLPIQELDRADPEGQDVPRAPGTEPAHLVPPDPVTPREISLLAPLDQVTQRIDRWDRVLPVPQEVIRGRPDPDVHLLPLVVLRLDKLRVNPPPLKTFRI